MGKKCFLAAGLLALSLNLASLLPSSACPYCPHPIPSPPPPPPPKEVPCPPPPPPKVKPPPPPKVKPPPPPPKINPPPPPKVLPPPPPKVYPPPPPPPPPPPKINPPPPPKVLPPPPPKVYPPPPPPPKTIPPPPPPKVYPPPPEVPCPPPPPVTHTCPINILKLDACVDLLGGLIHIGIGSGATGACCPVLEGLADLDAALCLCTTIRAKLLNINILLPIALEVLLDCGKHLPSDYQCPAA